MTSTDRSRAGGDLAEHDWLMLGFCVRSILPFDIPPRFICNCRSNLFGNDEEADGYLG